jgi:hypothetical protein
MVLLKGKISGVAKPAPVKINLPGKRLHEK